MTYLTSIRMNPLGRSLPAAFAVGALALMCARVHAADHDSLNPVQLDPITVSVPAEDIVGREATGTPIEQVTTTARIEIDRAALTTEYGVLMLNYSVLDAARKACSADESFALDEDSACVQKAVEGAKSQVEAAIAKARGGEKST
ncbi:MAG TPA: UrcA family protein [Steroidobacteraceae bacterium]